MTFRYEDQRYRALLNLAIARFGSPTDAEKDVLRVSASTDNSEPEDTGRRPVVRAAFLRWLGTDKAAGEQIDALGIRVYCATVVDSLDLASCGISFPLRFWLCVLKGELYLEHIELPLLHIEHCGLEAGILGSGARIRGNVLLRSSTAKGTIWLDSAQIGGFLDCEGTTLTANEGGSGHEEDALAADGLKASNVFLRNGFSARGAVRLVSADITETLDCSDANQFGRLVCDQMRVGQRMIYAAIAHPETAWLALDEASVGSFHDDERSWPQKGNLWLDGFVYQELVAHKSVAPGQIKAYTVGGPAGLDVESRIRWLRRQPDSQLDHAQPWMQLSKFLESMGDTRGAKHVIYEYHRQRVSRSLFWRSRSFAYDYLEEDPLRVGWFIGGFWAMGALVFWRAQRMGAMRSKGGSPGGAAPRVSSDSVPFSPSIYTLENVLPVVKLGQDSAWEPDPKANGTLLPNWWIFAKLNRVAGKQGLTRWLLKLDYDRLATLRWLLILAGWVLAIILAAAIGGQFKQ